MSHVPAWVLAVLFFLLILVVGAGLEVGLGHHRSFFGSIAVSDIVAASVAALLFWRVLWYERERRKSILRRVETISEMNHHIRNALHVISLSTYSAQDREMVDRIDESLRRIEWALKEILPRL